MEKIMEFILNLLLIKLKFAKSATKTVNEAIRRCLKFKSKIESEYNKATNKVYPYDSLEIMNYNASHYVGEAENCIVTREVPFDLYEKVRKSSKVVCSKPLTAENPMASGASASKLLPAKPPAPVLQPDAPREPPKCDDFIVENLHGILKSQELLFKNITKLINILEKDKLDASNLNLVKLKKKIQACANILSNQPVVYNVIEDLIEQEIVRCKLKVGVGQTTNEVTLNPNKPEKLQGLAVVTQKVHRTKSSHIAHKASTPLKHKIELWQKKYECFNRTVMNSEAIERSMSLSNLQKLIPKTQKCSHSATELVRLKRGSKKQSQAELEECKKLVNVVTNYFNEFENLLWHKTTTSKYLSIKNDYENMCKCGFKNKRHFLLVESQILKRLEQQRDLDNIEKMLVVNDSMFQLIERKLLFKNRSNDLKLFIDDLHQQKQTEKTFHQVPAAIEQINNNEPRIFALNNNSRLIGSKSIKPSLTLNSLKTFRVDGNNVTKFMQSRYERIPLRIHNNASLVSSPLQSEKLTRFLPEKITEEAEKAKQICMEIKQTKPLEIPEEIIETSALPASNSIEKELVIASNDVKNENYVPKEEIENAANLLTANKTAFEEMENVINVIRIFNDLKPPVSKSKHALKQAAEEPTVKKEVVKTKTKALQKLSPIPPNDDIISADFLLNKTKKFKSDEQITFQSIREVARTYIKLTNSSTEVSSSPSGSKQKTFLLNESPPSESSSSGIGQTSTYRQILANIKRKEEARQIRPKKSSSLLQRTTKTAIKKEQASLAAPVTSLAERRDSRPTVQKSSSASEHTSTKQNYPKSSSTRGKEEVGKPPSASGGRHQRNLSNSASTSLIFTKNSGEQFMWQAQDEKKFVRLLFNDPKE